MSPVSPTSDQLFLLQDSEEMREHLLQILQQGRQRLLLFNPDLDNSLFNHDEISDCISKLARQSQLSEIKIVVMHPQSLVDSNHKLLQLSRRLPSKIAIQKLTIDPPEVHSFMIVDQDKLWLQHQATIYEGFANYAARPEVKHFATLFNELWKYSEEDPRLRQLVI